MHRATVAAGIGFAVFAIAGCGSGGRLLSSAESKALDEQLSRVSADLDAGDCDAAENDLTAFQNRVAQLNGVNSTLIQNLTQGANTVQQLTSVKCSDQIATTPTKKKSATTTSTRTQTNAATTTTATDTDTINTNTYTTSTYTAPYTDTQTSTTGGSGLYGDTTTTDTSTTATTPTTITTTSTTGTDTTGGAGYSSGTGGVVGSASSYSDTSRARHPGPWGSGS